MRVCAAGFEEWRCFERCALMVLFGMAGIVVLCPSLRSIHSGCVRSHVGTEVFSVVLKLPASALREQSGSTVGRLSLQ